MNAATRTVVVLFADLVDSTAHLVRLPPHAADATRDAHLTVLRDAVVATGGDVIKNLGDGVMVTFDSARAAVRAAEELQRGLQLEARRSGGRALRARVGIAAGDATPADGDWFGEPVIEASRLCGAAAAEQILVSDVVVRLAGRSSGPAFADAGRLALKGLPDPVATFEVRWTAVPAALRLVVADDDALLRQGLVRLLVELGFDVVAQAADAEELLVHVEALRPDVVVTDMRMPPSHTTEGLDAAKRIRARRPGIAIIILSQHVDAASARGLLEVDRRAVGYLLKHRVTDVDRLGAVVRGVAAGDVVLDPELDTAVATG